MSAAKLKPIARKPRLVLDLLRKLIAEDTLTFSTPGERAIVNELIDRAEEAEAVVLALLGAMPPALQKKWPNICERANRVAGGGA